MHFVISFLLLLRRRVGCLLYQLLVSGWIIVSSRLIEVLLAYSLRIKVQVRTVDLIEAPQQIFSCTIDVVTA